MLYVEFHRLRWKKKPKGELFTETTNRTAKYCQLAQPCFRLSPKPPSTRCSQTSQVEETRGREATARTAPRGDPKSARDACVRCCPAILSSHSSSRSPLWQQLWDGGAPWSCLGCSLVCSQAQTTPLPLQPPAGSSLFPLGFSEPPVRSSQLSGEASSLPSTSRSHYIFCWPPSIAFLPSDLPRCQFLIHLKFCSPIR